MRKILLLTGVGIIGVEGYFAYKLGVLQKVNVQRSVYPGGHLVYLDYQGDLMKIENTFNEKMPELAGLFGLPGAKSVGVYYDDPLRLKDRTKARALVGVMVPPTVPPTELQGKYDEKKFQVAELPEVKSLKCKWPYFNKWSFVVMYFLAYPAMEKTFQEQKIANKDEIGCAIEVYNFANSSEKSIDVHMIYGENKEKYGLTKYPQPPMKPSK